MIRLRTQLLLSGCLLVSACAQPSGESADVAAEDASPSAAEGAATAPAEETAAATSTDEGVMELTPKNTQVQFVATHTGDEPKPRTGVFQEFAGQAKMDGEQGVLESVSVEIQTKSLITPIDKLTNHLKAPDFLDVREYPTITFQSTQIAADGDTGKQQLTGDLTLMETTREVSFPVDVTITGDELTLSGKLTINRTEYGMDQHLDGVNDAVEITVAIGQPTVPPESE